MLECSFNLLTYIYSNQLNNDPYSTRRTLTKLTINVYWTTNANKTMFAGFEITTFKMLTAFAIFEIECNYNQLYVESEVYGIVWSYYGIIVYASTFFFIYIDSLKNIMRLSDKRFAKCSYAFSRWYWCVSTYVFPVIDDNQLTTLRFAYTIITTIIRNADMIISKQ